VAFWVCVEFAGEGGGSYKVYKSYSMGVGPWRAETKDAQRGRCETQLSQAPRFEKMRRRHAVEVRLAAEPAR
jgi:hypothetical protein